MPPPVLSKKVLIAAVFLSAIGIGTAAALYSFRITPWTNIREFWGNTAEKGFQSSGKTGISQPPAAPLHSIFSGTLSEVRKTPRGTELVFRVPNPTIKDVILVTKATRIFKLSSLDGSTTRMMVPESILMPGLHLDISAEHDPEVRVWTVRDLFIRDNKNSQQ